MDIDPPTETLALFDLSSEGFPFKEPVPHSIEARRAALSDVLIFDMLLSRGGIVDGSALYPPTDADTLSRLLNAIEESTYDRLKKDCLIYYLLKWHTGDERRSRETAFVADRCIPPQFMMLADAYWALDTGNYVERAVSLLADSRINRDYASKILQSLALPLETGAPCYVPKTRIPSISARAPLILRYIRSAKPLLVEPDDLDLHAVALAEASGIASSWTYQRTFPEHSETRSRLIKLVLDWALTPLPRPNALRVLLSLPFTPYERTIVHLHATHPPSYLTPAGVSALRDATLVRLLQAGSHAAALRLARAFANNTPAPTASYSGAARAPPGPREDDKALRRRQELVDEIRRSMPEAERALLDAEFDTPVGIPTTTMAFPRANGTVIKKSLEAGKDKALSANIPADLSASWEEIRLPISGRRVAVDPPIGRPISEIAGAPRFGLGTNVSAPRDAFAAATSISARASTRHVRRESSGAETNGNKDNLPSSAGPRQSIYDTSGSARVARNAFYDPPPLPERISAKKLAPEPVADPVPQPQVQDSQPAVDPLSPVEEEAGMDVDSARSPPRDTAPVEDTPDTKDSYGFSVFSSRAPEPISVQSSTSSEPISARASLRRTKTGTMHPPGAFMPTPTPEPHLEHEAPVEEDVGESASAVRPAKISMRQATSAAQSSSEKPVSNSKPSANAASGTGSRQTRASASAKTVIDESESLSRSLPGTLNIGSDEDEHTVSEREDAVPPMRAPPVRATRSKRRISTGLSDRSDDDGPHDVPPTPRRSSRLSREPSESMLQPEEKKRKMRTTGTKSSRKR